MVFNKFYFITKFVNTKNIFAWLNTTFPGNKADKIAPWFG